jgi:hypothetical protein
MNTMSRVITGIAMVAIGLWMFITGFFVEEAPWVLWIYGTIVFVVAFFLIFNKAEDEIEQISYKGGGKK